MTTKIPLPRYLFTRLRQHNVHHIHGVPGDFMLKALDHLKPCGLHWVGNCNELNAGYAADGYARVRGLGALFTTYGVGELSAINAVAASYSEHVPVVHIVGTAARTLQKDAKGPMHHSLGDGRLGVFREMYEKVTVAQANLWDEGEAPEVIDEVVGKCLREQRPVYVELPSDMVHKEVDASRLEEGLQTDLPVDEGGEDGEVDMILGKLYTAKQPLLLVDRGSGVQQLREEINELVTISKIPTLAMPTGNGMVEHAFANYYGVHSGPVGHINTMPFLQQSDLILAFGPMFSDTQTLGWTTVPPASKTILLCKNTINSTPINTQRVLRKLLTRLDPTRLTSTPSATATLGNFRTHPPPQTPPNAPITQTDFYHKLTPYLRPHDTILLANATPILGGRDLVLPPHAQVIASGMAFSIGHMLPAAQGVALAKQSQQPRGRTILLDGDGSFQVSVQELSTIMHRRLDATIFIMNNEGYAYERLIHGAQESYNDIAPWDYLKAVELFGKPTGYNVGTWRVGTWAEMEGMFGEERFWRPGLKLVEVRVGREDVPEKFRGVFEDSGRFL